ncbi:hypothetical protein ACFQMA_26360 [Halosimplex aquaticum]|uniref:Uncharacterized protein n=1 Tax=Halosimplex aquaticum TaxID=3026162 RepID=A0ABD5Y7H3_9EURY
MPPALVLVSVEGDSADGVFVDEEACLFAFAGDRELPAVEIRSKVLEIVELSRNRPIDDVSDNSWPCKPIDTLEEADTIVVERIKHEEKIARWISVPSTLICDEYG